MADSINPAAVTPPYVAAQVSPTGTPLISPKAVPYVAASAGILSIVQQIIPQHTIFAQILGFALPALVSILGIASPGLRR